jgi:hypothetical protein
MREADTAHVALISIEFLIHHAGSLKDKRSVTASVKNRLRARFNASVAEVAYLDEWQRCGLGLAMIGNDRRRLEQDVNALSQFLREVRDIELVNLSLEWM